MPRLRGTFRLTPSLIAALVLACAHAAVHAQDVTRDPTERHGEVDVTYQYSVDENLVGSEYTIPTPPIRTQVLDFYASYALKERWTLEGGLPLISRKWEGPPTHDPLKIVPPHPESEFIDDGHYHTYVQDLRLGVRYLWLGDPLIIEPYVMLGLPASDYPFFAASAPGEHVSRQEIGSTFAYRPPFLKWFFSVQVGYQFVEETLGVNKDATRVDGEAVYFASPKVAVKVFFSAKNGHGIRPLGGPSPTEVWYHHDQLLRNNYTNMGLGVDWSLNERNVMNVSVIEMVRAEDIFALRGAVSVSLARKF